MEEIKKLATEIQQKTNNTMEVCLFFAEKMINDPEYQYNKKQKLKAQISIVYNMLLNGELETEFFTKQNENR